MTMPGRVSREADEKRAYYRLLRYLLGEEVGACYGHDDEKPLPSRMMDLLNTLEQKEPRERH